MCCHNELWWPQQAGESGPTSVSPRWRYFMVFMLFSHRWSRNSADTQGKIWDEDLNFLVYKHMICKISSANRMLPLTFPYLNWLKKAASFTVGCIESRWTLKHKPEVKVLTLMCVVLNSWALFPLSFWKSSPGAPSIKADLIRLQLGDITDTLRIKSRFRTPAQRSSLWDFATPPASCQAQSRYGFTPGNLEMKKRRISSSKFRVQD